MEAMFFSIKDWFDGISYSASRIFSGAKNDFKEGEGTSALKNIEPVIKNDILKGEGVWTTDSLSQGDEKNHPLLARTIYRPDPERPYALVDLLYIDTAQVEFSPVGELSIPYPRPN